MRLEYDIGLIAQGMAFVSIIILGAAFLLVRPVEAAALGNSPLASYVAGAITMPFAVYNLASLLGMFANRDKALLLENETITWFHGLRIKTIPLSSISKVSFVPPRKVAIVLGDTSRILRIDVACMRAAGSSESGAVAELLATKIAHRISPIS